VKTPETVPPAVQALLNRLGKTSLGAHFYLAGGTALALLVQHRRSVDLDFFSRTNRLTGPERQALITSLEQVSRWTLVEEKDGTLHGRLGRVKVSFFWYPQPLVKPPTRRNGIPIASLEDIGLMKIGAVIGRGSRKDFFDLHEICRHVPLAHLLQLGRRKFKNYNDFALQALKALCYFEDAEKEPEVVAVKPIPWKDVRGFFARQVQMLGRPYLEKQPQ